METSILKVKLATPIFFCSTAVATACLKASQKHRNMAQIGSRDSKSDYYRFFRI